MDELRAEIRRREEQASIDKYSTTREDVPFKFAKADDLKADDHGALYHIRVEDGCEGWEALIEIDRTVTHGRWTGDLEKVIEDHV